ncbi:MAG: DUF937 domain-containing protein [Sphingomonadaceae bacterium]|nr:DUF937 domain-containing protein [Sphingomonadaceae bacterium]
MSQPLIDLVNRFGGEKAVEDMAARVGLSPEQTQSAIAALMPAVAGGLANKVETEGPASLDAAAAPATSVVAGEGAASDAAVEHGGGLLGSLFGGHAGTNAVADHAAAATGLDASKLAALLPMVATLAAGALGHAGNVPGEGVAPGGQPSGGIGGMLGGLMNQIGGGQSGTPGGAASVLQSMLAGQGGNALEGILGGLFRPH